MATKSSKNIFAEVLSTNNNAEVTEKALRSINGSSAILSNGVEILLLVSNAKKRKVTIKGGGTRELPHIPYINLTNPGGVEWLRLSDLREKMGYEKCPKPGEYTLSQDGEWWILKPQEDDEAVQTFTSGGFPHILKGALQETTISQGRSGKTIGSAQTIHPVYIKCTGVKWLYSGDVFDKNTDVTKKDTSFHANVRMWSGEAHFVKPEEMEKLLKEYNEGCYDPEDQIDPNNPDYRSILGLPKLK